MTQPNLPYSESRSGLTPDWAKPFVDAADPDHWTVFDLRTLRAAAGSGRFGTLAPALVQMIFGFDALVVLSKSGPQHDLLSGRP